MVFHPKYCVDRQESPEDHPIYKLNKSDYRRLVITINKCESGHVKMTGH